MKFIQDDYNRKIIYEVNKLKESGFQNILIIGGVGTGKTSLVQHLFPEAYFMQEAEFKQYIVKGDACLLPTGMLQTLPNILDHPLEALSRLETVIYDDYGVSELTPAMMEKTLYWLDQRQKPFKGVSPKRTIFTTNLTLEELKSREGRIASRILNKCHVFLLDGKDRREESTTYY